MMAVAPHGFEHIEQQQVQPIPDPSEWSTVDWEAEATAAVAQLDQPTMQMPAFGGVPVSSDPVGMGRSASAPDLTHLGKHVAPRRCRVAPPYRDPAVASSQGFIHQSGVRGRGRRRRNPTWPTTTTRNTRRMRNSWARQRRTRRRVGSTGLPRSASSGAWRRTERRRNALTIDVKER